MEKKTEDIIGIVELDHHHEVVLDILRSFPGKRFLLLVSAPAWEMLRPASHKYLLAVHIKETPTPAFLDHHLPELRRCSKVYFTTIASHFSCFHALELPGEKALILHNAQSWLAPKLDLSGLFSPQTALKNWGRLLIRILVQREQAKRRQLLQWADQLLFLSPELVRFSRKLIDEEMNQKLEHLPVPALPAKARSRKGGKIHIVIPGTIDRRLKNYSVLAKALHLLKDQQHRKIKIFFPGKVRSTGGARMLRKLISSFSGKVAFWMSRESLAQKDYDAIMEQADYVLLLAREKIVWGIYREFPGRTKITGGERDALRFNIPVILPAHYSSQPDRFREARVFEGPEELAEHLNDIAEG
jgi:hypothetical protein